MKPKTTAIARAPQSRGISASLRRLAVRRAGNILAASALFALGAASAQAQVNYQYTGGGAGTATTPVSGMFSTGFTPTIVSGGTTSGTTTNDTLSFGGTDAGAASYTATDDLTTTINVNALSFSNIAGVVATLARGGAGTNNSITLGGTTPTVTSGAGGVVNALDLILAASTGFNIGAGGFAQNGVVSGAGGLIQNGTGTLTLNATNTYTGGTTVNAGTLALNRGGGAGTVRGVVTVNSGATLNLATNNAIGYNADGTQVTTLNINGGTVDNTTNGDEGFSTNVNLTGGTLKSSGGGLFRFNNATPGSFGVTSNASATTSTISTRIDAYNGPLNFNVASGTTASGVDLLVSGAIITNSVTKSGAGVMSLTGANTYNGATTISAGTLQLGNGGTTGTLATGSAITDNDTFTINRSNAVTQGTDFSGAAITGTGGLIQNGTGTLTLNATNTYTGGTTVNAGTLALNRGGGAGTVRGVVTVNSGATLNLTTGDAIGYNADGTQVTMLNINGGTVNITPANNEGFSTNVNLTGGTLMSSGGGLFRFNNSTPGSFGVTSNASATTSTISTRIDAYNGPLNFNVASGTTASGVDLLVSGAIIGNSVTKSGAGVMSLTGANTYTGGTTVTGGTLNANAANSLGTGALAVNNANTGAGTNVIVNFNANQTVKGLSSTISGTAGNKAQINIASGSTLTDTQSGTTNYAGSVAGGGTLSIGGQSSAAPATVNYTGTDSAAQTNVNANATLQLNNSTGPALSGPVAVATSGTVLLGSNNQIATTTPGTASPTAVALNGGTFNANGHSDGTTDGNADPTQAAVTSSMGTLSLASGASTLDFGSGSTNDIIAFADSLASLQAGNGTLNIINYTGGTDALYIGTTQDLTQAELSRITFGSNIAAIQLSNGLVAAPEPSQYVSFSVGLLGLGALVLRAKNRKQAGQPA